MAVRGSLDEKAAALRTACFLVTGRIMGKAAAILITGWFSMGILAIGWLLLRAGL